MCWGHGPKCHAGDEYSPSPLGEEGRMKNEEGRRKKRRRKEEREEEKKGGERRGEGRRKGRGRGLGGGGTKWVIEQRKEV